MPITTVPIKTEQQVFWHTVIDHKSCLLPGVIVFCDADTEYATIQVRKDGQITRETVSYDEIEVRS